MRAVVGCTCFVLRGSQVLLLHRNHPPFYGRWDALGGVVDFGESPREAVLREVYEESGLHLTSCEERGHLLLYNQEENLAVSVYLFVGTAGEGELQPSEEGLPVWFDLEAIRDLDLIGFTHITLPLLLTEGSRLSGTIWHDRNGYPTRYDLHHQVGPVVRRLSAEV